MSTDRIRRRFPLCLSDSNGQMAGFHDNLIRAVVSLAGCTDVELLKRALRLAMDAAPIAGCRVVTPQSAWRRPYFERLPNLDALSLLEVFTFADQAQADAALETWSLTPMDPSVGPLVVGALFRVQPSPDEAAGHDTLCLRIIHSFGDGTGTIQFLYLLSSLYAALEADPNYRPVPNNHGDRSFWQIIKTMSLVEIRRALQSPPPFHFLEISGWSLPQPAEGSGPGILVARELPDGRLETVRTYAKAHGVTVNDVFLAAHYRAVYRLAQPPAGTPLTLMTHVNHRRRLPDRQAGAIANLAQPALVNIGTELGVTFDDTVALVHAAMERVKQEPPMLHMLVLGAKMRSPLFRRRLQRKMAARPRPKRGVGAPPFNNIGQIDPSRLSLGVPATNAYLTACLSRAQDPSIQLVLTTCGEHVNLVVVTRDIGNNRETLDALLDAFEQELTATA